MRRWGTITALLRQQQFKQTQNKTTVSKQGERFVTVREVVKAVCASRRNVARDPFEGYLETPH